MIVKSGKNYLVKSMTGKTLGVHPTKEKALAQLRAIERSKTKAAAKKAWTGF